MELELFNFKLPEKNIAFYPEEKGSSRLLVCFRDTGKIKDEFFQNLPEYLEKNSLLILNDSKVYNARVYFNFKDGKKGEILILKYNGKEMECLVKPAKKISKEKKIQFSEEIETTLIEKREDNTFFIKLNIPVEKLIEEKGKPPLPPYIKREIEEKDKIWYQTIYAKKTGSIAAPTAGLHFNEEILKRLKEKNINIGYLTLHVGVGTFKPIRKENIEEHKMEEEYFEISQELCNEIEKAKGEGRKIISVGTTTTRALESAYLKGKNRIIPYRGKTDLFIYPGFKFSIVDCLLTNFHLPKSTPLCLVAAFAGLENIKKWYQEALNLNYRFLSYGDAMLII